MLDNYLSALRTAMVTFTLNHNARFLHVSARGVYNADSMRWPPKARMQKSFPVLELREKFPSSCGTPGVTVRDDSMLCLRYS